MRCLLFLFALFLFSSAQTRDPEPLTNQRVIQLVQGGVQADELSRLIGTAPTVSLNLIPTELHLLLDAGISPETIKVMAARQNGQVSPTGQILSEKRPVNEGIGTGASPPTQSAKFRRGEGSVNVAGGMFLDTYGTKSPAFATDLLVSVTPRVSAVGTYAYNNRGNLGGVHRWVNEFVAGVRVTGEGQWFRPFGQVQAGVARASYSYGNVTVSDTPFAASSSIGANMKLSSRADLAFDVRAVAYNPFGIGWIWYFRPTVGVTVHIGR